MLFCRGLLFPSYTSQAPFLRTTSPSMVLLPHMGKFSSKYQAMCVGTLRQKRPNRAVVQTTSTRSELDEK